MSILNRIFTALGFPSKSQRLADAKRAHQAAGDRYLDALRRGDCRDQHHAYRALVEAQNARLRIETEQRRWWPLGVS